MRESYFYKTREEPIIYGISPNLLYDTDHQCIPISEDEYHAAIEEIKAKAQAELEAEQEAEQTYVEQLEIENAALLFQILTGEVFKDV